MAERVYSDAAVPFTDRYELDLMRLAAGLRDAGAEAGALAQQGEAERLRAAD